MEIPTYLIASGWENKQVHYIDSPSDAIKFRSLTYDDLLLAILCETATDYPMQQIWEQALNTNESVRAPMFLYYNKGIILLDNEFKSHSTHTIQQLNHFPSPQELADMLPRERKKNKKRGERTFLLVIPLALISLLAAIVAFIISLLKRTNSGDTTTPHILVTTNSEGIELNSAIDSALRDLAERQIPNVSIQPMSHDGWDREKWQQARDNYDMVIIPASAWMNTASESKTASTSTISSEPITAPTSDTAFDSIAAPTSDTSSATLQPMAYLFPAENVIAPLYSETRGTNNFDNWIQQVATAVSSPERMAPVQNNNSSVITNIVTNYHNHSLTSITNWNELLVVVAQIDSVIHAQNTFNQIHIETMAEKDSIRAQIEMAEELKRYLHGFQERLGAAAENYKKKCDDLYDAGMLREKIEYFQGNNLAETINRLAAVVETINDRDIPYIEKYIQQLEEMLQND